MLPRCAHGSADRGAASPSRRSAAEGAPLARRSLCCEALLQLRVGDGTTSRDVRVAVSESCVLLGTQRLVVLGTRIQPVAAAMNSRVASASCSVRSSTLSRSFSFAVMGTNGSERLSASVATQRAVSAVRCLRPARHLRQGQRLALRQRHAGRGRRRHADSRAALEEDHSPSQTWFGYDNSPPGLSPDGLRQHVSQPPCHHVGPAYPGSANVAPELNGCVNTRL
jgi:hypothetical protein